MSRVGSFAIGLAALSLSAQPVAAASTANERDDILASCKTQTWMPAGQAGCPCIADKAVKDLTPKQREWLIVSGKADPEALAAVEAGMTQNDKMAVGTFVAQNMMNCKP